MNNGSANVRGLEWSNPDPDLGGAGSVDAPDEPLGDESFADVLDDGDRALSLGMALLCNVKPGSPGFANDRRWNSGCKHHFFASRLLD